MKNKISFIFVLLISVSGFAKETSEKNYLTGGLVYFSAGSEVHWQKNVDQVVDTQGWTRFELGLSLSRWDMADKIVFIKSGDISTSSEDGNISIKTKSNLVSIVLDGEISKLSSDFFSFNYDIGISGRQNVIKTSIAGFSDTDRSSIYYGAVTGLNIRGAYRFIWAQVSASLNFEQNIDLNPEPAIGFVVGLKI